MSVVHLSAGPAGGGGSVAPLVFGFMPGVQFGLVAGSLDGLGDLEAEQVNHLAAFVAAEIGSLPAPMGISHRMGRSRLLLIGVPVDATEVASGRTGLCVSLGLIAPLGVEPTVWVQMLAAMSLEVSRLLRVPHSGVSGAAGPMARLLQGPDGGAVRQHLDSLLVRLGALYSHLAGKEFVSGSGRILGEVGDDPACLLAEFLLVAAARGERNIVARYLPLAGILDGGAPLVAAPMVRFVAHGVLVGGPHEPAPGSSGSVADRVKGSLGRLFG